MASYQSAYTGTSIDKAGLLPSPSSGTVGQFLKKANASGVMEWDSVVTTTTKLNNVLNTNSTNLLLFFTNQSVITSDWESGTDYINYPYYATIILSDVTANYYPEVIFNPDDAVSGYFAPVCESIDGGVKIFASDIPDDTVTIPTIKCTKAG